MIGKTPKEHQMSIFEVALESFIDMNHELVLLSKQIDWEAVESEFAEYYWTRSSIPMGGFSSALSRTEAPPHRARPTRMHKRPGSQNPYSPISS